MRLRRRWLLPALLPLGLLLLAGVVWAIDTFTPSEPRRALPPTATDIHEYYDYQFNWNGDYARCLVAKIPASEMPAYAKRLGLNQRYHARAGSTPPYFFSPHEPVSWWRTPASFEGAYYHWEPGTEACYTACYSNGYVYYSAFVW